jgi:hypothetical protein
MRSAEAWAFVRERRRRRIWRAACQSAIQSRTMTGSPLRRLQEFADEVRCCDEIESKKSAFQ